MSRVGTPLVLLSAIALIALLAGLFVFAEAGYGRLSTLTVRISDIQERQTRLALLLRLVIDGETSERGYLLIGDERYLEPLAEARSRWNGLYDLLVRDYERAGIRNEEAMQRLRTLALRRFEQFDYTLALHRTVSPQAAVEFVRRGSGGRTMEEIRSLVKDLEVSESNALVDAFSHWLEDLQNLRVVMATLVLLNMVLVVLASVLVYRQFQRGATQTSELQEKVRLSVTELAALSSHLQYVSEREKKALARDLHDALGGLLVGTKMDVAWIRNRLGSIDAAIETRFARIQQALDQGIDFKRRVVEQLRPSLLDNMGLFAALRWQFQENCARANLQCHHTLPQHELVLLSDAAIGLFRVVQEALTNILKHAYGSAAWLDVEVLERELQIRVADNGRGMTAHAQIRGGQGLTSMRHRVTALGGSIEIRPRTAGGTEVLVRVPLARILASGAAEESTDGAPASSATALPADQT